MGKKNVKTCVGCLYYSSYFRDDSKSPVCYGLTTSHPHGDKYGNEPAASSWGKLPDEFKFACVGCSYYVGGQEDTPTKLPACVVGLKILTTPTPPPPPNKQDGKEAAIPSNSSDGDEEFLSRFTRNANVVADGVSKSMRRVGDQIKQDFDNALNAIRRRPK